MITLRPENDRAITQELDRGLSELIAFYKHIHAHPELSGEEHETSQRLADYLERCGIRVLRGIAETGVAGVLENGEGPTLLIRGDMDALPITEQTGADYASTVRSRTTDGREVGVMHACGHDLHTTMLAGTADLLSKMSNLWQGTVIFVGQPAEETASGARRMIEDGLFERVPRPDSCLAIHVSPDLPAGTVGITSGWCFAGADMIDVTVYGRGGHAARPHQTVDPIIVSAHLITALQTLVSRNVDPQETAVVAVAAIHAGARYNIIPDQVALKLTLRYYTDSVRDRLRSGLRKMSKQVCLAFGCPKEPAVTIQETSIPASYNDPQLTQAAAEVFRAVLGDENVVSIPPVMAAEDFAHFSRHLRVPGLQFRVGAVDPGRYEESLKPHGPELPTLHSSSFCPPPEPTLRTAIRAMSNLAIALTASPKPS